MTLQNIIDQINQSDSIKEFANINLLKLSESKDGRFILNYNEQQLNTPKGWIAHYCRGLTLAGTPHNYKVIAKSLDRFYNLHEKPEYLIDQKQINFNKPFEVQFKYDGSLILLYKYNGKVCINTRGSFADSLISSTHNQTWEEVFADCMKSQFVKESYIMEGYTYIYELCTPYNQVVEYYPKPVIQLLGIVRLDGTEFKSSFEGETYTCSSLEEVMSLLQTLQPTQEGFVIAQWDEETQTYLRLKLKTKTWLELSHIKESALSSASKLWEVVFSGEKDEVSSIFPHIKNQLDKLWNEYQETLHFAGTEYDLFKYIENQKEFALAIKDCKYKNCYFPVKLGKATLVESIQNYIRKNN